MRFRQPRIEDENHLKFLRGLPCLVCEDNTSTEAAHIRMSDARAAKKNPGVGQKPHDFWCVPLCGRCHREQHEVGEEALFWNRAMIDPLFVALALYVNSGDQEAGETIIKAQHLQRVREKIMTPLQIKMMLHYYAIAEPYAMREPEHAKSNAVVTQREALIAGGMLEPCNAPIDWRVTDRGRVYVEALTHVPWPEKKWVMPGFEWPQH